MDITSGIGIALGFLLGIVGHEYVTARVADSRGDKTARLMGRLTLSPKAHMDPLGSVILPAIFVASVVFSSALFPMFGYGKRHSLNPRTFRNPRNDVLAVSLAGPLTTLAIAAAGGFILRATASTSATIAEIAFGILVVNSFLTVIELLPIPGRDGGRILQRFLSPQAAMKMEELLQYDVLFLLLLFFLGSIINGMVAPVCDALAGSFGCL